MTKLLTILTIRSASERLPGKPMNTCKTCHHWQRKAIAIYRMKQSGRYFADTPSGEYIRTEAANYGECACPKFKYNDIEDVDPETGEALLVEADSLLYWDDESYAAHFITGEDFGCIHWIALQSPDN